MDKPLLYLDVDGVLFGRYGYHNWIQLRPDAFGFVNWCTEFFDCYWLTCWSEESLANLLMHAYAPQNVSQIDYINWRQYDDKVDAIDLQSDFYWIEDGIGTYAMAKLLAAGREDRYIAMPFDGEHALEGARSRLGSILEQRLTDR